MTPRRLLNCREVGEKLGLSNRAVTQRLGREAANIPEPDFWTDIPGRGRVYLWLPRRKDLQALQPAPDDPVLVGYPDGLPGDMLIGPRQLAALTGWSRQYVITRRYEAGRRRAMGVPDVTDLPPEDEKRSNSPRWRMETIRAWQEAVKAARGQDISEEK